VASDIAATFFGETRENTQKILLGLVVLVVILAAVGFMLPREVHLERQVEIKASPAPIYTHITGMKAFHVWSPWADKDPDVGSKMSAKGNSDVGEDSQEVTGIKANERVDTHLDFGDQGTAEAYVVLKDLGNGSTQVTWGFDSDMGAGSVGRWFGLFMDGMLGPDYEKGLSNLKGLAEKPPAG
jgi:hypothetical protein